MKKLLLLVVLFALFGLGVSAEILNEKTELSCIKEKCTWIGYEGKQFEFFMDRYWFFQDFLVDSGQKSNTNINYSFVDGTEIVLVPFVEIAQLEGSIKSNIEDLPLGTKNTLAYNGSVSTTRDDAKLTVQFLKLENQASIGFQVRSTHKIYYMDYNYSPEGVYEKEPLQYPVTDLIINGKQYSFTDLIEDGFSISFDKENNELFIYLENKSGLVSADPSLSFFSAAVDGHCVHLAPGGCNSCVSNTTTNPIGSLPPVAEVTLSARSYFSFDTSSIPADYISIDSVELKVYRHLLSQRLCNPGNVHRITYRYLNDTLGGVLSCVSTNKPWIFKGYGTWGSTTGFFSFNDYNSDAISPDGNSDFCLGPDWVDCTDARTNDYWNFRSSEYAGTSSDPVLIVNFTIPSIEEDDEFIQLVETQQKTWGAVDWYGLAFIVIIIGLILGGLIL